MKKTSYAIRSLFEDIKNDISWLSDKYIGGLLAKSRLTASNTTLNQYDLANEDYCAIRQDAMEHFNMFLRIGIVGITMIFDYATLYHAMLILCSLGIPNAFKYILPSVLVFIEIGVSYFTSISSRQLRYGAFMNTIHKYLPYFVIVLLIGLSTLAIVYTMKIPSSNYDIFWQIGLLISSVMLHLWLIRHATDIVYMFGYLSYRMKRSKLVRNVQKDKSDLDSFTRDYTKKVPMLIEKIDTYYTECTSAPVDIFILIPEEQITAMITVMGKNVFMKYRGYVQFEQLK
ncbi:MAG: hypothetical protein JNK00_12985 [Flavipsychrobacter sp.]|nr:hypothetical protein [Flavipsychrobacter sp.]